MQSSPKPVAFPGPGSLDGHMMRLCPGSLKMSMKQALAACMSMESLSFPPKKARQTSPQALRRRHRLCVHFDEKLHLADDIN
jgi:hypothetical protein